MSGKLVGEVLDAAEAGHLDGLSRPAFHALLAIAEKCHHQTRQGSVRKVRIQAAIYVGNSTRTADRAIRELKAAGLVQVVKRGFKAPGGKSLAPIYQLAELSPPKVAEATGEAFAKTGEAFAKTGQAFATQGGVLDGSIDGSIDGERGALPPPAELSPYCQEHPGGTDHNCRACGTARTRHEAWTEEQRQRDEAERSRIRAAIDACSNRCDDFGRLDDFTDCPHHPNFRTGATS